jgi:hypothetical protein
LISVKRLLPSTDSTLARTFATLTPGAGTVEPSRTAPE